MPNTRFKAKLSSMPPEHFVGLSGKWDDLHNLHHFIPLAKNRFSVTVNRPWKEHLHKGTNKTRIREVI